jgi:diphthine synthase
MLVFIGLGLGVDGMSLRGLREAQEADMVFAELYTSLMPELDLKQLEQKIGKQIKVVGRDVVVGDPREILEAARKKRVAFMAPGDSMVATTHVDLRLRAAKAGIETKVIHAASIASAAAGLLGLQSYKFGSIGTIPFQDNQSTRPYDILTDNLRRELHTLLLLDIGEGGRSMAAEEAIKIMMGLEERLRRGVFTPSTLVVVVSQAGSENPVIRADRADRLRDENSGDPPYVLVVPGRLHFVEAEALKVFAGAPEAAVLWHMHHP